MSALMIDISVMDNIEALIEYVRIACLTRRGPGADELCANCPERHLCDREGRTAPTSDGLR